MADETLEDIIYEVDVFKKENINQARHSIEKKVNAYKKDIPKEADSSELDLKIQQNIDSELIKFNKDMEINPTALYYSLKSEAELNETITKKELTLSAYDFLERNTKSKLFKKILKELKKETKNG